MIPPRTLASIIAEHGGAIQTGPFGSQLHQSDYASEGIPFVMPKDIVDGRVNEATVARVPEEKARQLSRHFLKAGDIVFPRRGDIGKCALIRVEQEGFLCGSGCLKIQVPPEVYVPRFLYYYLGLRHTVEWLERNAVGTTMLNLSEKIVGGLPLPIIALRLQLRIAGILSAYDDLIENNRRRIRLLEEAARLLYREWFVHLRFPGHEHVAVVDGVPVGWERKTLGELCEEIRETVDPGSFESATPYIGLEHMPRRSITLGEWGAAGQVTSSKHRFLEEDILFGKIRPYFHKVGVALTDGIASSDAIVIRPREGRFHSFVLMTVSSDPFVAVTAQTMKEGSKMPRADWKQMRTYPTPLPPASILDSFNEFIRPIIGQLKALTLANRKLSAARDLLLPRLMNGEISI